MSQAPEQDKLLEDLEILEEIEEYDGDEEAASVLRRAREEILRLRNADPPPYKYFIVPEPVVIAPSKK